MNTDFSDLKGKTCVITGGAGVIGFAICEALATAGVNIAILDLNKEAADWAANELNKKYTSNCIGVEANVLEKESLEKAHQFVVEKFKKVDILINAAGGNSPKATTQDDQITDSSSFESSFFGLETEAFDTVFALNFKGTLLPTMIFAKDMVKRKEGVILNISSMNSFRPLTRIPAYSAAKASVNNFTQWLAVHLAKTGVRVNAIAPGFFLTNQNRFLLTDEKTGESTARGKKILANTPVGHYGEPEDLQGATLFLVSNLSKFITGVVIPVDGGFSAFSGV